MLIFKGKAKELIRQHNERMALAWTIANLSRWDRRKPLPKLETLQHRDGARKRKPQSWQEQLKVAEMLHAMMVGKQQAGTRNNGK